MRKAIFAAVTPTTSYDNNRVVVKVQPGPVALGIDYTKVSSTNIMISVEFAWTSSDVDPDVTTDALWWPPAKQDGSADNETTVTTTGRSFIDLSGRMPASSVGNTGFPGYVPTGVTHMRVRVKGTGTLTSVLVSLTLFYNGPSTS